MNLNMYISKIYYFHLCMTIVKDHPDWILSKCIHKQTKIQVIHNTLLYHTLCKVLLCYLITFFINVGTRLEKTYKATIFSKN